LRFVRLFHDERFHAGELLLEPIGKIVRSVLEKYDEAKGKKQEQNEPKEAAQQRHDEDGNLVALFGQRLTSRWKFALNLRVQTAMLLRSCACRSST
jgi:HD-like signal output (HDOD) protein